MGMNDSPAWLEVPVDDAVAFARRVLEFNDSVFGRWVLEGIDLTSGSFGATARYALDDDGLWNDAGAATEINRVTNPEPGAGDTYDLKRGVRRIVSPLLEAGRLLVVGNSFTDARLQPRDEPGSNVRVVQREDAGGRFETYFVVPGPAAGPDEIDACIWHAIPASAGIGVVSEVEDAVPEDRDLVSDDRLRALVARPDLVFMRMVSYDGFLIWHSSKTSSQYELRTIGNARSNPPP